MKNKKIKIIFSIFGDDFDTNQFTKVVEVLPTNIHIKGNIGKYKVSYKETSWDYEMVTNQYELDNLSDDLVSLFKQKKYKILNFKKENKLTIKFFLIFHVKNSIIPSLFLNRNFLDFLDFFNAEIDIDGYCDD